MSSSIPLIRASALIPSERWLIANGRPAPALLEAAGLPPDPARQPARLVSLHAMFVFVERMAAAEGLDFAARVSTPEALMTIGAPAQAIRASRTVREVLVRVANTFHLHASHMFGQAHVVAGGMELAISIPIGGTAEMHHQAQQHTAAFVSCLGRLVNGRPLPARVEIAPHPSRGVEHLKPFLGEDVVPGTPLQLRMWIPDSALDLELPPSMLRLPCPERMDLGPIGCSSLEESARVLVAGMVADGCPSLDRLAFQAGRSRRTLQRLLAAERTSFAAVLDSVRQNEAMAQINSGRESVTAIAGEVGYRSVSSLSRAVRRWTDSCPRQIRSNRRIG